MTNNSYLRQFEQQLDTLLAGPSSFDDTWMTEWEYLREVERLTKEIRRLRKFGHAV